MPSGLKDVVHSYTRTMNKDVFFLSLVKSTGSLLPVFFTAPKYSINLDLSHTILAGSFCKKIGFQFQRNDNFCLADPIGNTRHQSFYAMMKFAMLLRRKFVFCFQFGLGGWNSIHLKIGLEILLQCTKDHGFSAFCNTLNLNDNGVYTNRLHCFYEGACYLIHEVVSKET